MSGHTPGPWEYGYFRNSALEVRGAGREAVCEVWQRANVEKERANAALIAAAPELLEVLQRLERAWSTPSPDWATLTFAELPNVRAAISKATT